MWIALMLNGGYDLKRSYPQLAAVGKTKANKAVLVGAGVWGDIPKPHAGDAACHAVAWLRKKQAMLDFMAERGDTHFTSKLSLS